MRKKTAPQIQKNREAPSRKASGLIAQDLSAQQSATLDCVLDNRSHRTRVGAAVTFNGDASCFPARDSIKLIGFATTDVFSGLPTALAANVRLSDQNRDR